MGFSINLLEAASDADALLLMATRDKRNLLHRKETLTIKSEHTAENANERALELTAAKAELDSTISLISTLPDGAAKEDQEIRKLELELKIRKLSKPGNKVDTIALLQMEYDADLQERQITGMDAFIAAVTERKAHYNRL